MKTASTSRLAFLNPRVLIGFALYAAGLVLAFAPVSNATAGVNAVAELSPSVPGQAPGRWILTGDLTTPRVNHTATLLPNRQVLAAAGENMIVGGLLASAELYDPATGVWTITGSPQLHAGTTPRHSYETVRCWWPEDPVRLAP